MNNPGMLNNLVLRKETLI